MYYRIPDEYFLPVVEVEDLDIEKAEAITEKSYRNERVEEIIKEVMSNEELNALMEADEEFIEHEIKKDKNI